MRLRLAVLPTVGGGLWPAATTSVEFATASESQRVVNLVRQICECLRLVADRMKPLAQCTSARRRGRDDLRSLHSQSLRVGDAGVDADVATNRVTAMELRA